MRGFRSEDLVGQRFGMLTVLSRAPRLTGNRGARWVCLCDCGGQAVSRSDGLRSGGTKSCGCLSAKTAKAVHTKHGKSYSREYVAWANMVGRCSGRQPASWKNYGGRGIAVCHEWVESFEAFYAEVGDSPGAGYELDRIDNNEGYRPGNCRWVTKSENNKNRRRKSQVAA